MNREQQVNELEKMKEQVLANNGDVPQPKPTSDENSFEETKPVQTVEVPVKYEFVKRLERVSRLRRNGYVDAIILSFITSFGGGIILYLIISAI